MLSLGRAIPRTDGVAKVTGATRYTGDIAMPGMLAAKFLRSPYPSARILSIDVTAARALPGVHAVLTAADVPDRLYGRLFKDVPILARGVVRFIGEKVAAVAAETVAIAEEALRLIEIDYEELPAVFDAAEAMTDAAPRVHDQAYPLGPSPIPLHGELHAFPPIPNVMSRLLVEHGDLAAGFAAAARVFEHDFAVPAVHQGYIEPHGCIVAPDGEDGVDIWIANKAPHLVRLQLAAAVELPMERIRLHPVPIGGDFGGKGSMMDLMACYYLARASGRPVRSVMTYTEELTAANPRHAAQVTLRTAVAADGRILAMDTRLVFNAGAYGGFCPLATLHGYAAFAGPYRVPACRIEALRVYTNQTPAGHMRAPGGPQITFAVESQLDIIAHALGLDPLRFRALNAIREGDASPLGDRRVALNCERTVEVALSHWNPESASRPGRGRGVALYEYPPGTFGRSTVSLTAEADGTVTVLVGLPDTGTGSHTVVRQLVAESLGLPVEQIRLRQGDTQSTDFETGSSAARVTTTVGRAVQDALATLRPALLTLAAERLNCAAAEVAVEAGGGYAHDGHRIDFAGLMAWAAVEGRAPIVCKGENRPTDEAQVTSFAAQIAWVDVDAGTGRPHVARVVTIHDVGTVINPITHQGQIEGGLIQSLGQALTEQIVVRDGAVAGAHLGDYKMPTIMDIPDLETVLVPGRGLGPFDVKAIGEMSNVALPAAIANAVFDAVGVRLFDLPITAEKIYAALAARRSAS